MVSGGGTNLQVIMDRVGDGYLAGCRIGLVISSRKDAYALVRAEGAGLETAVVPPKGFADVAGYDAAVLGLLERHGIGLIVLAGFASKLGPEVVRRYEGRVVNVHPALMPSFCGKGLYGIRPHVAALEYGVKVTGATVHFIEEEYDTGAIILQKAIEVHGCDTPETLQRRVMEECEWVILPQAIKLISEGRVLRDGRKVTVLGEGCGH